MVVGSGMAGPVIADLFASIFGRQIAESGLKAGEKVSVDAPASSIDRIEQLSRLSRQAGSLAVQVGLTQRGGMWDILPDVLLESQRRLNEQMRQQLDADVYRVLQSQEQTYLQSQLGGIPEGQKRQATPEDHSTDAAVYGLGGYKAGPVRRVHQHRERSCEWPRCTCFRLPTCAEPEEHAPGCRCIEKTWA